MLGPTGNHNNPHRGASDGTVTPPNIRVAALTADTLQYLGSKVAQILTTKVLSVTEELPSTTTAKPNQAVPNSLPRSDTDRTGANYRVELSVDGKRLTVAAALAPRIGQLLQLEVLSAKEMKLLDVLMRSGGTAGSPETGPNRSSADQLPRSTSEPRSNTATSDILQTALKKGLPRQLPASELTSSLATIARLADTRPLPVGAQAGQLNSVGSSIGANPAVGATGSVTDNKVGLKTDTAHQQAGGPVIPASNQGSIRAAEILLRYLSSQTERGATATASPHGSSQLRFDTRASAANQQQANTSGNIETALRPVVDAATRLSSGYPAINQLTNPANVQQAIANSGHFYEQKLVNTIHRSLETFRHTHPHTHQNLSQQIVNEPATRREVGSAISHALGDAKISEDHKFRLLDVAHNIKTLLKNNPGLLALLSSSSGDRKQLLENQTPLASLWQLELAANAKQTAGAQPELADALLQLLRIALGISARTQNQQLFSLGTQQSVGSDNNLQHTLTMNLPVWIDQTLSSIELRFEHQAPDKQRQKKSQDGWHLRMRFDLEPLGELTALASLRDKNVSAVLWASRQSLARQVEKVLPDVGSTLSDAGINVQALQCRIGVIDSSSSESIASLLHSSLLDIRA